MHQIKLCCHSCARDYDGKVTPEEVASAAMYLKDTLGKEGIQELISNLSKDRGMCILYSADTLICLNMRNRKYILICA